MKKLKDIKRLPVWATRKGQLRLQWWPVRYVLRKLPQCPECCFWYFHTAAGSGDKCVACETGNEWAVARATERVLEALTLLEVENG